MVRPDAEELVEVERGRLREVRQPLRVQRPELVIQPDRRAAGGQPEHQRRACPVSIAAIRAASVLRERALVLENRDLHSVTDQSACTPERV